MDGTDEKKAAATVSQSAHDEIDFTSGFETQYHKEYSPLRPKNVPPPDKRNAWYRSASTIMMIIFLALVFLLGTVMLVVMVFTASPLQVLLIVCVYVVIAALMIWIEVNSIKVR